MKKYALALLTVSLYSAGAAAAGDTEWICRVTVGEQGRRMQRERWGRVVFDAVRFGSATREAAEEGAFMGCYREPFIDDCYLDSCQEVPAGTFAKARSPRKRGR
jgi:hypothetical protein